MNRPFFASKIRLFQKLVGKMKKVCYTVLTNSFIKNKKQEEFPSWLIGKK